MLYRDDMHDYQDLMVDFAENPTALDTFSQALWGGMGVGKTVVTLTVALDLLRYREISKVLVVTPKSAAQYTWADEHLSWDHLYDLDVRLITTTPEEDLQKRTAEQTRDLLKSRMKGGDVHVINPERLEGLISMWGWAWPYDMVVLDDTKGLKRPKNMLKQRLDQIRSHVHKFLITNGTPMPNGYLQLWPQIHVLDQGKRLKKTATDYKRTWFYPGEDGFKWHPREGAVHEINAKLDDICTSIDGKDVMDVPEDENYIIDVPLEGTLRSQYRELEKNFYLKIDEFDEEVIARSKGILYNKLKQFCNGAVFVDPLNPNKWVKIHDNKLDKLEELYEELNGENILLAYQYKPDLERLQHRFGKKLFNFKTTRNVKDRWNAGEIPILCMHPGSAGHGLNLQWGGRTTVWYGTEWSLELNDQMNQRAGGVRMVQSGLNVRPRYYYLTIENSIETTMAESVIDKRKTQDGLKKSVKLDIERRL